MESINKNSTLQRYTVEDNYAGLTLEVYLKEVLNISSRQRQKLFFSKCVFVNGRAAHSKRILRTGETIGVRHFKDNNYGVVPQEGLVEVLYEDKYLIVVNKPAGILVHPTGQTESGTLANYLAWYFKQKKEVITIRPLHRLDRDTSGCVLFAKTAEAQTKLELLLKQGEIHRCYEAVVCGNANTLKQAFPSGILDFPIEKDPFSPNRRRVGVKGQRAITKFNILAQKENYSLLALELETGRTHQIRVHMAHVGYPVLGDKMYGRASRLIKRQALHAVTLSFRHPETGVVVATTAPRPEEIFCLFRSEI